MSPSSWDWRTGQIGWLKNLEAMEKLARGPAINVNRLLRAADVANGITIPSAVTSPVMKALTSGISSRTLKLDRPEPLASMRRQISLAVPDPLAEVRVMAGRLQGRLASEMMGIVRQPSWITQPWAGERVARAIRLGSDDRRLQRFLTRPGGVTPTISGHYATVNRELSRSLRPLLRVSAVGPLPHAFGVAEPTGLAQMATPVLDQIAPEPSRTASGDLGGDLVPSEDDLDERETLLTVDGRTFVRPSLADRIQTIAPGLFQDADELLGPETDPTWRVYTAVLVVTLAVSAGIIVVGPMGTLIFAGGVLIPAALTNLVSLLNGDELPVQRQWRGLIGSNSSGDAASAGED